MVSFVFSTSNQLVVAKIEGDDMFLKEDSTDLRKKEIKNFLTRLRGSYIKKGIKLKELKLLREVKIFLKFIVVKLLKIRNHILKHATLC